MWFLLLLAYVLLRAVRVVLGIIVVIGARTSSENVFAAVWVGYFVAIGGRSQVAIPHFLGDQGSESVFFRKGVIETSGGSWRFFFLGGSELPG